MASLINFFASVQYRYSHVDLYVLINDQECTEPAAIDGVLSISSITLIDRPTQIEGYCENIPSGEIRVGFKIGQCSDPYTESDGFTGWQSISRIMITKI